MSRERPLVLIPQTASAATNSSIPQRAKRIFQGFVDLYLRSEKAHALGDLPVWSCEQNPL